jgi:hypothetical protein
VLNGQGTANYTFEMKNYPGFISLLIAIILLSGCSANNEPEINPQTGMPKILCGAKPVLEKANKAKAISRLLEHLSNAIWSSTSSRLNISFAFIIFIMNNNSILFPFFQ